MENSAIFMLNFCRHSVPILEIYEYKRFAIAITNNNISTSLYKSNYITPNNFKVIAIAITITAIIPIYARIASVFVIFNHLIFSYS